MNLPENLTRTIGRSVLKLKKESPHIFFVAGVVGAVTSTVLACRATLKLSETLEDIQKDVNEVRGMEPNVIPISEDSTVKDLYSNVDYRKDLAYVYVKGGAKIAKLYAPAAIVGVASISCLTGSHVQMTRRNAALMAAYAAVQEAYANYRERVREKLGDEGELEIYHSVEKYIEDKEKKELNAVVDPNTWSPYARFFDEYSPNWEKDPERNRFFVQCQQNYANHKLKAKGHVFLNEIYDQLGLDRSSAGAVVGWIYNSDGDNFIDFGMYEAHNSRFIAGEERSILLDFNVDGIIYDKI